ncbi:hypothetical protein HPB47_028264 [Ixodes persulcatus]|uniref:Uncharacterized protein n=1 Tax=Ixodes persulcatus TaxID=34615 RepID=A0AC60PU88_IXOPE|nr:hypothetical protein HPB47_028264 [Ixodes persulcatus]
MGLVLATGYKASLTALLRDVPLEAEHPTFPNRSSVYLQECVRQLFGFKDLWYDTSTKEAARIVKAEYLRLRKHKIISDKKYFPMTYEFVGRHTSTIHEELRKFDYVSTGEPILGVIVGPEIMYAWQFREAFAADRWPSPGVWPVQQGGSSSRIQDQVSCLQPRRLYRAGGVDTDPDAATYKFCLRCPDPSSGVNIDWS